MDQEQLIKSIHFLLHLPYFLGKLSSKLDSKESASISMRLHDILISIEFNKIEKLKIKILFLLKKYQIQVSEVLLDYKSYNTTTQVYMNADSLYELINLSISCLLFRKG